MENFEGERDQNYTISAPIRRPSKWYPKQPKRLASPNPQQMGVDNGESKPAEAEVFKISAVMCMPEMAPPSDHCRSGTSAVCTLDPIHSNTGLGVRVGRPVSVSYWSDN